MTDPQRKNLERLRELGSVTYRHTNTGIRNGKWVMGRTKASAKGFHSVALRSLVELEKANLEIVHYQNPWDGNGEIILPGGTEYLVERFTPCEP